MCSGLHSGWRKITGHLGDYYPPRPRLLTGTAHAAPTGRCRFPDAGAHFQAECSVSAPPHGQAGPAHTGAPWAPHPAPVGPPRHLQAQGPGPSSGARWVTLPVALALIQHLHLPENPTPNVARLLLDDLDGGGAGDGAAGSARPSKAQGAPTRDLPCAMPQTPLELRSEVLRS